MNDRWSLLSPDAAWVALFEQSPNALLLLDAGKRLVAAANRRAEARYGFGPGEMDGLGLDNLLDPGDQTALEKLITATARASFVSGGRHRRKDGSIFHVRVDTRSIPGKDGPLLIVRVRELGEPDLIDAASGLPDPRLFIDRLEQSIVHAHRENHGLCVCLVFVARLDELLDDLRVDAARRLLHELGDRLRANLRESDTVARVGKAEFAVIVEGVVEKGAILEVLRKVTGDFEYEFGVGDEDMLLEPSIGVSVYPHDGHLADMLVENAAAAAARARAEGGRRIRFFTDV